VAIMAVTVVLELVAVVVVGNHHTWSA